jgi:hypothetical protein
MRQLIGMTLWAINAFRAQRWKKHGRPQTTRVALVQALQGFHIGMCWTGAVTDPTYWLLKGYDVAGVRKR